MVGWRGASYYFPGREERLLWFGMTLYDSDMAKEPPMVPIDVGKTEADKLADGVYLLGLSDEDGEDPNWIKKYTNQ